MRLDEFEVQTRLDATHPMFREQYLHALEEFADYPSAVIFPEDFAKTKELFRVELDLSTSPGLKVRRNLCHAFKAGGLVMVDDAIKYSDFQKWVDAKARAKRHSWRRNKPVVPEKPTETGLRILRDAADFVQVEHNLIGKLASLIANGHLRDNWNIYVPSVVGACDYSICSIDDGWRHPPTVSQPPKFILTYLPMKDGGRVYGNCEPTFTNRNEAIRYGASKLLEMK